MLYLIRLISVLAIAFIYMLFDLFNKRNVPSIFVYGTVAYGALLTILYFKLSIIGISALIALIVFGIGYVLYRTGQLGAADIFELAAISLIIPYQPTPFFNFIQYGFPFIFSLLINSGIIALIILPIYYLPKYSKKYGSLLKININKKDMLKGSMFMIVYILFLAFVTLHYGFNIISDSLIIILAVFSLILFVFEKQILYAMVRYVPIDNIEDGDIIATNLIESKDIERLSKIEGFGRLATDKQIKELKAMKFGDKLPVYKEAFPFALPIFLGVIAALLVGNIILLIIP